MSLLRRAGPHLVATSVGAFVTLQLLVAFVRGNRHVLFWWEGGPLLFVALCWALALALATAGGLAAAWLARTIEPMLAAGRPVARLLAAPPPGPSFWLLAGRRFPEPLAAAGWTVSRPVQAGTGRSLHLFRVRPPADAAGGPGSP